MNWFRNMGMILTDILGSEIAPCKIYSTEKRWDHFCDDPWVFEPNHPVIFWNLERQLFVVLPASDYELLENGLDVKSYIDSASWNVGHMWDGASVLEGTFWFPAELADPKIKRYLHLQTCKVWGYHKDSVKYGKEKCETCWMKNECTASPAKNIQNVETHMCLPVFTDYRTKFRAAVYNRVRRDLGVEVAGCYAYNGEYISVMGVRNCKSVTLHLPSRILNDLLCNPGERDWEQMADELQYEIAVCGTIDKLIVSEVFEGTTKQTVYDFWKEHSCTAYDFWKEHIYVPVDEKEDNAAPKMYGAYTDIENPRNEAFERGSEIDKPFATSESAIKAVSKFASAFRQRVKDAFKH